ncbi:LuxR C-terminal-related transcriptional regulator [Rhodococcus sp. Rp3]|uniref:LuxR C-terminal-related transcriptional regulator n=1 Tax=Rhodococcus sp. Rp3 TaxID=2807635 RepID=UPI00233EE158|nr:LuxR C-terminal-related transcriptional regulator [Rhodococcus sp. Rp3]MDC3725463.1 LuxR family transcriptional regulator [Rhodococcus sp. Rp3]
MTTMLEHSPAQKPARQKPALSAREIEILRAWLLCESKSEAAASLFVTAATVSTHIVRIREKYARVGRTATTKTALLARALQDGVVSIDEL